MSSPTVTVIAFVALPFVTMPASGLHRRSNVLEHLLVTVLNAGDANAPHHLAFETAGVTSVDDVLELNKDGLKYLSWKDQ